MAEYIYGNRDAVIDLNSFEDTDTLKSIIKDWKQEIQYEKINFNFNSLLENI